MPDWLQTQLAVSIVVIGAVIVVMLTAVAYCIYFERKISAWIQNRHGPNRVGPYGLLQPLADGLKFLLKEDIIPALVDRPIFILAPTISFVVAMVGFAVIPWGGVFEFADGHRVMIQAASLDVGLLYILAVGSLSVYGIVLAGWASNNKFAFYGSMRAAAQMLSYEIPMGLGILVIVLTSGHLRLENIVIAQANSVWYVFLHPLAFIMIFITSLAETNRTPFDLAEAEQELVGGFHVEYSALKFAMFFLAEYMHIIIVSAFMVALFFGGYHLPGVPWCRPEHTGLIGALAKIAVFSAKIACFIFLFIWVRWTVPRFRFDQLMRLAWKGMVPLGLGLVALTSALVYLKIPESVWAPFGNVILIVIVWIGKDLSRVLVTGRQAGIPPVPPQPVAAKEVTP